MKPEEANSISQCDADTYAAKAAEAAFILLAQTEMQKIMNRKGLRYRDLARRMGVTEARVSQMFGDTATNLTIKTVARVFHQLGETAYLTTLEEFERQLADARGAQADDAHRWTVIGLESDKFQMAGDVALADAPTVADVPASHLSFERWLRAEAALPRRTAAAAA